MRRYLAAASAFAVVTSLLLVPAANLSAGAVEDEFEAMVFKAEGEQTLNYRLLKPQDVEAGKKYPLVLFLHGAGERGDDNKAQLKHVVRISAEKANREKFPCFVMAPQCPKNARWADVDWGAKTHATPEKPSPPMALLLEAIERLKTQHPIDEKRLYVMGLSMGGYGTWDLVSRRPEMFAAAVPICGGGDEGKAEKLVKLPIWCFHGGKDTVVPTQRSRNMIEALKKAGGSPKYTEYADAAHDSWTPASREPELLPWLFSQKRP